MSNIREKVGDSLVEKLVLVNKVSKTVKGGKNMSFAALVVVGDKKGRVGVGSGKAREVVDAKNKAFEAAKKNLVRVPLKEGRTIHHDIYGKFGAGEVLLRTAVPGTGVIAGDSMRAVLECLGLRDVVAKSMGSGNRYNVVMATMDALGRLNSPKIVAERRSKAVNEIIKRRDAAAGVVKATAAEEVVNNDTEVVNA